MLGLILVIATMGLPGIAAARAGYQISTAGYTIAGKVDEARTNALKRNRQAWLLINGPAQSLKVQSTDTAGTVIDVGIAEYIPKDVAFVGVTTTQQVTFDAMGRPVSPPQTIQVQHARSLRQRTVTIMSTGRVTVQ